MKSFRMFTIILVLSYYLSACVEATSTVSVAAPDEPASAAGGAAPEQSLAESSSIHRSTFLTIQPKGALLPADSVQCIHIPLTIRNVGYRIEPSLLPDVLQIPASLPTI